ncbi:MAG: pyridoxal-phosphate dependent enzyme [Anaerolineaceae bacterium]|nr:pyridoxal-phosphate dependent enzyme [Anaerolineaceae bacterium]
MRVICQDCKRGMEFDPYHFHCDCGGPWEMAERDDFDTGSIRGDVSSLWRYIDIFGIEELEIPVTLGAGWTPLVTADWEGKDTFFKLEYVSPTGSFKDRGTEVEVSYLKAVGVQQVIEDSSGNAGAAMAAYSARAGIQADVYSPASASPNKLSQIEIYGARLHRIPGPRFEATKAALKAAAEGTVYASHAYSPVYALGQQTFAWEIWEQSGGSLPDAIVIPTGQGGLLLGAWFGFRRLMRAGIIEKMPNLYSAQPERLAPIHYALENNMVDIPEAKPIEKSIAEGLAIIKPVRGKRVLQALRESGGGAVVVTENEIYLAYHKLAQLGLFVEPTSAVAAAAVAKVRNEIGENADILVALTGSGLKVPILKE